MARTAMADYEDQGLGGKLASFPERTRTFLQDVRTEMKHVSYPSVKEVRATTTVVLITTAIFGLFFYLTDWVISRGVDWIFHRFTS